MMHGREKSDSAIVAVKPANKAAVAVAESVERRPGAKGNAGQQSTRRAQTRTRVTQALDRVRQAARLRKKERFTALLHHVSIDTLQTAFYALKRKAAPGVDGMTWQEYETGLELRLATLHARIHRGAYRPQPARRTYIPKADGKQRPLAIAALEDKIVQGAGDGAERHLRGRLPRVLVRISTRTWTTRCVGCPGRRDQHAEGELIMDADIRNFFDSVSQDWLVRFVEHRVGDKRITRLIQKWLRADLKTESNRQ